MSGSNALYRCEAVGCENLTSHPSQLLVVNEDGKIDGSSSRLCEECRHGLVWLIALAYQLLPTHDAIAEQLTKEKRASWRMEGVAFGFCLCLVVVVLVSVMMVYL